jgi:OmpA-OmpF porin, OOP family
MHPLSGMGPSRRGRSAGLCLILAAVLGSSAAMAQTSLPTPPLDLERLQLNPGATDSLVLGQGGLLPRHGLRTALVAQYEKDPLVLNLGSQRLGHIVHWRATAHLTVGYGVSDWVELGFEVPYIVRQQGDAADVTEVQPPEPRAPGSPRVQGRLGLLRERDGAVMDLAVSMGVSLPLGSPEALTRQGSRGLAWHGRVGMGRSLGFLHLGAEVGLSAREPVELGPTSVRDPVVLGDLLEGGVALSTRGEKIRGELSLRGALSLTNAPAGTELLAGVRIPLFSRNFELFALGGPGFGRLPGTPTFRLLSGLAWAPVHDR